MLDNEELLFDELYEKTKNCGRTQFIKLLMRKERQQKEFINYLEDEINKWNYNYDSYNYEYEVEEPTAEELANKILQKYKEIIGVDKQ